MSKTGLPDLVGIHRIDIVVINFDVGDPRCFFVFVSEDKRLESGFAQAAQIPAAENRVSNFM